MHCKILYDLRDISFPKHFVIMSTKYFQLKALKVIEILSGEQMGVPEKCKSWSETCTLQYLIVVVSHFTIWEKKTFKRLIIIRETPKDTSFPLF